MTVPLTLEMPTGCEEIKTIREFRFNLAVLHLGAAIFPRGMREALPQGREIYLKLVKPNTLFSQKQRFTAQSYPGWPCCKNKQCWNSSHCILVPLPIGLLRSGPVQWLVQNWIDSYRAFRCSRGDRIRWQPRLPSMPQCQVWTALLLSLPTPALPTLCQLACDQLAYFYSWTQTTISQTFQVPSKLQ